MTKKDWVAKYIKERSQIAIAGYCGALDAMADSCRTACESPIEIALGFAMATAVDEGAHPGRHPLTYFCSRPYVDWPNPIDDGLERIGIFPQSLVGQYRVDFLILCENFGKHFWVVVECDGHDFHERTKDQAKRDRSRDRWMTANKISVMRFTGSEIFASPDACAEQVADFIAEKFGEI